MRKFVVTTYDGPDNKIGHRRGEFGSMDEAVAALAQPNLIRVGNPADLRAVAWEEDASNPPLHVSYYVAHFVGADSE